MRVVLQRETPIVMPELRMAIVYWCSVSAAARTEYHSGVSSDALDSGISRLHEAVLSDSSRSSAERCRLISRPLDLSPRPAPPAGEPAYHSNVACSMIFPSRSRRYRKCYLACPSRLVGTKVANLLVLWLSRLTSTAPTGRIGQE